MSASLFVTKQFIDDLDRLTEALGKRFARSASVFAENHPVPL